MKIKIQSFLSAVAFVSFTIASLYISTVLGYIAFLFGGFFVDGMEVFMKANWALFSKELVLAIASLIVGGIAVFLAFWMEDWNES